MPTKKKATQKQKQKQSQVVNIHIGDKGGQKKRRPRAVRHLSKQPIVVNVSTPQMSIPSFENRTFLDGAKFSSSVPINELAPAIRTNNNEFIPTPIIDSDIVRQKRMENLKKFIDKLPEKIPEKIPISTSTPNSIPDLINFSSISVPPPSPFIYTPTSQISPISQLSPVSSIYDNLYDSYPNSPFITNTNPLIKQEKEKEYIERKKMNMEEQMTKIRDRLIKEQKEKNLMGMEDLNSRLQNDMFNENKERNLMDKEDVNVQDIYTLNEMMNKNKSVMPPRRTDKEIKESYNMGLEDPTTPKKPLSKLNKIELQQLAQRIGIQLTRPDGYQREKKELQDMIRQSGYK